MSLFRVLLVLVLSCNVYSFSQAADPVAVGGVTAQNIADRSKKVLDFAAAFPTRVLTLYTSVDASVNNFNKVNTGFKGLSDLLTDVYSSTIKKELMGLPEQVKEKIAFVPAQNLINGLLTIADEKLSLGIFPSKDPLVVGYLDVLDIFVTSIKTFIDKLHPRIEAELARVLPVFEALKPYVKTATELNDATKNDIAKIIADTKVVTDFLLVAGAGELVPQDKLQAADQKLKIVESLITKIDEPLKKAEPIAKTVHDISVTLADLERQIVPLATPILKDTVKPMAKLAGEIKNNVLENADKYTKWLNAATFGVVKDIIEINKLDITTEEVTPLSKPNKSYFVVLQTFAKNFTLSSKAGESQEQYEKDMNYLIPELSKLPGLLTPIVSDFTNVGTQATAMINAYMKFFNELSLTKISIGGKVFGIDFEKYRIFDIQQPAFRCFARYMVAPKISFNLGIVELKGLSLLNSSCSLMKIADLNDPDVTKDFKDFGNQDIKPGQFYKTTLSYSTDFIKKVENTPLLKDIFKSGSMPVFGKLVNVGKGQFLGSELEAVTNEGITIDKVGTLTLRSFGIAVVEDPDFLGKPKIVLPVRGSMQWQFADNFKPLFDLAMVFDTQKLAGTLSGIAKETWQDALGIKGLVFSNPGLSITAGVVGGVTGVGLTAQAKLGKKEFEVMGNVDLASPRDAAYIAKLKGGLGWKDIIGISTAVAEAAGKPIPVFDGVKNLPELSLRDCELAFIPREMMLFGKMQKAGVTLKATANFFGKNCEVFINFAGDGFYGSMSLDPLDLKVVKMEGLYDKALNPDKKIVFAISGGSKGQLAGLYCDVNVTLLGDITAQGKLSLIVSEVPVITNVRISDLIVKLGGFGNCKLDVSVGINLNEIPTNLASIPWKVDATFDNTMVSYLKQQIDNSLKTTGKALTGATKAAAETVKRIDPLIGALDTEIAALNKEIASLYENSLAKQGEAIIQSGIDGLGAAVDAIGVNKENIDKGVKAAGNTINAIGNTITNLGNDIGNLGKDIANAVWGFFTGDLEKEKKQKEQQKRDKEQEKINEEARKVELQKQAAQEAAYLQEIQSSKGKIKTIQEQGGTLSASALDMLNKVKVIFPTPGKTEADKIALAKAATAEAVKLNSLLSVDQNKKNLLTHLKDELDRIIKTDIPLQRLLKRLAELIKQEVSLTPEVQKTVESLPLRIKAFQEGVKNLPAKQRALDEALFKPASFKNIGKRMNAAAEVNSIKNMFEQFEKMLNDLSKELN